MNNKKSYLYFNIVVLILTTIFLSISVNFLYAEPISPSVSTDSEETTETTTEAGIINNFCEPGKIIDVNAEAAILIDADTGLTFYEKNADKILYPASITKIITTLLGCEYGKFDEKITHSHNAIFGIGPGSSTMGMQEGETISLKDALYGVMLCSANETSMAVAEHVAGSVDKFVDMMNNKAKDAGCKNTHFANPHGFHDDNHYTTARDMSLIAKMAVKNKDFAEIWGTVEYTLPATNLVKDPRVLYNKAKIVHKKSQYYYENIVGAKTGFHDQAMNTIVCCAEKDGVKLIAVVMKAAGYDVSYTDAKKMFEYGFTQCKKKKLYDGSDYTAIVSAVQTYNGKEYPMGEIQVGVEGSFEKNVPKLVDAKDITVTPILDEKKELPVVSGDKLGEMKIEYKDIELGKMDIVAKTSIDKTSDSEMAKIEFIDNVKKYGKIIVKYGSIPVAVIVFVVIIIRICRGTSKKKKKKKINKKRTKKVNHISAERPLRERPSKESTRERTYDRTYNREDMQQPRRRRRR